MQQKTDEGRFQMRREQRKIPEGSHCIGTAEAADSEYDAQAELS